MELFHFCAGFNFLNFPRYRENLSYFFVALLLMLYFWWIIVLCELQALRDTREILTLLEDLTCDICALGTKHTQLIGEVRGWMHAHGLQHADDSDWTATTPRQVRSNGYFMWSLFEFYDW